MEGHKIKMSILVGEINRINEENRTLNSMLKRMSTSYSDLQKQVSALVQQRKQKLTCVDRSQIFNPDDLSEENFDLRILSPRFVDVHSGSAVFHQSYNSWDCRERDWEKEGKKAKFMDDQQLPSKKRKTNYIQLEQTQSRISTSSMDDNLGSVSQQSYDSSDCSRQVGKKEGKNAKFMDDQQLPSKKRKTNYIQLEQTQNRISNSSMDDNLGSVFQQSYDSSDCSGQVRKKEGKNAQFMDDQQLPSKKRKRNYFKLDQTQNGVTLNLSMDAGLICDKPPKKKHNALKKGSNRQTADCAKDKF